MPIYGFGGLLTLNGSAQPLFGTTTSAAATPVYDQFAGNVTGANQSQTTLALTSMMGFRIGQMIICGTSSTLYNSSIQPNVGLITGLNSAASTISVKGLNASVPSGAYVLLNEAIQTVTVAPVQGNSALIYLGRDWTTGAASTQTYSILTNPSTGTYVFNVFQTPTTDKAHAYNTTEFWINGANGDKVVVQMTQG